MISLPNFLTLARIVISPLFLIVYLGYETLHINEQVLPFVLLVLFVISELSDAFDGYFARKYGQVTDLGKILDPMADSIARISVFLTFTQPPVNLPMILVFVFIYRDAVVSTLRTICALKGFALAARASGKIKAVIQAIAALIIILMLIPYTRGHLSPETLQFNSTLVVLIAAVYTLYSGVDYIYANREYIARMIRNQGSPDAV
jgi:CDP-diacylglycerol--glycerol-3-phosphate 3-phosphatidyltransferase